MQPYVMSKTRHKAAMHCWLDIPVKSKSQYIFNSRLVFFSLSGIVTNWVQ